MFLFYAVIGLVALERLVELRIARTNERWARAHGAVESGAGHYPVIVALHAGLLAGAVVEVVLAHREFRPILAFSMLGIVLLAQALRWACIVTLGRQWNTRVLVVPGMPLVRRGPYLLLPHPNYLAVAIEGAALPLIGSAWITAVAFTVLNTVALTVRLRAESRALAGEATPPAGPRDAARSRSTR